VKRDRILPDVPYAPYNYNQPEDKATNDFFAAQAKAAGMSVSAWMAKNGMIGAAKESMIRKYERPESTVPNESLEAVNRKLSIQAYRDEIPGGAVIASIIGQGTVAFKKDLPKRRRGRPRKHFIRGEKNAE
jgi:hypothetical protein